MHQKTKSSRISIVEKNYAQILKGIPSVEPRAVLYSNILAKIEKIQVLMARLRLALWSTLVLSTAIGFGYSYTYLVRELSSSDFFQYLSLVFSDGGIAMLYGKELLLSLVETIPLFSITVVLFGGFVLLGGLVSMVRDSRKAFYKFA